MTTSAADLLALQDIDLRRDARRALIADIDSRLGETEAVIEAREAVASAEAELDRLRREQRALEAQLEDLDAKIAPIEKKLYDGSVRNPKELTDLQRDVESQKARRSHLDDEGLALIETVEAAANALATAKAALTQAEAEWKADQAGLEAERDRAQRENTSLEEERQRWAVGMDASALGLYEGLRQTRQGRAVSRIERGACQGCRLSLPTHIVQRVRTGTILVQCPSCERILVGA
jgi:predicted  nucleic acid-binding Zn-ribbon protein